MQTHLTPTALAKAKALSVVAAALTAGGAGGMIALSQVSNSASSTAIVTSSDATTAPTAEPSETPTVTPTESATDAAAPAPTTSTYALPSCPADVKNHGAYVSGVAHSAPKGKGGEHGKWVSQAAHSDCGKSAHASDGADPVETESPESPEVETHSPKPAHSPHAEGDSSKHKGGHGDH